MLSILTNGATAAHLAMAAVAPLVLSECCSGAAAPALVWVTIVAAIWALMAPSRRFEEHHYEALARVSAQVTANPCTWFLLALVGYAAVVALNGGVGLRYDYELAIWKLSAPGISSLPGGVSATGGFAFVAALVALVVFLGVAHALDARQSVVFALVVLILTAVVTLLSWRIGHRVSAGSAVVCGIWSMVALAILFSERGKPGRALEMTAFLGLVGCLSVLLLSLRGVVLCVFMVALVAEELVFIALMFRRLRWIGVLRTFVLFGVSCMLAAAVFHYLCGDWSALLPEFGVKSDSLLARYALSIWETHPWLGVGAGGFPLAAKLAAAPEDWVVLGAFPDFYRNWFLAALGERGLVALVLVVGSFGALVYVWIQRVRLGGVQFFTAALPLLPLAVLALAAVLFFDGSAVRADALVAFASLAAFSVNGGT